jgi:phosphate transport system protein
MHARAQASHGLPERLLGPIAVEARSLLRDSLDALARQDSVLAKRVIAADAGLDQLERETVQRLMRQAACDPDHLQSVFRLGHVARCLERIGDHATNVAEMVAYIAHATVVRHGSAERPSCSLVS